MESARYDVNLAVNIDRPQNIIICGIDNIIEPYIYFLFPKNTRITFEKTKDYTEYKRDYVYKGCIFFENENYILFEHSESEGDFLPMTDDKKFWKILPFEILYSKKVLDIDIDDKVVNFFKNYPKLLCITENNYKLEVPVVGYVGIGKDDLNEQIIMQTKNNIDGIFKRGFYFLDYKDALNEANYERDTDDYLLKLKNISVSDSLLDEVDITIEDDKFFINNLFIGDVPKHCNQNAKYMLYYYDKDVVYLKSDMPNRCELTNKQRDGIVIRYVLFLKRHWIGSRSRKHYDSFAYNSIYMVKSSENFACISYHLYKK
jgi:hypothetical protein